MPISSRMIPAPLRGMNSESPVAAMRPDEALTIDNLLCRPGALELRPGYLNWTTGFGSQVSTLMPYKSLTGSSDKIFAASGAGVYDVTASGAVGAAVVAGLTSSYLAFTQLSNVAGNYLIYVNGADTGQTFDGTTWAAWAITGVASTSLTQLAVHKRRVWAVEKNSFKAWYSAADAIAGAMTQFTLAGVFRRGGYLVAIIPWTIDAGAGADDQLLFITSEGEVAVYAGTDPASASTWSLQGLYYISPPVGKRFYAQYNGDVLLLTAAGLFPFSAYLQNAVLNDKTLLSSRIRTLLGQDIQTYGATTGWELLYYPEQSLVLIQVPSGAVGSRYQWAMDTRTRGWSRLYMSAAITFATFGGILYAGHSAQTAKSWTGGLDNVTPISYRVIPAFVNLGNVSYNTKINLGRVLVESDSAPTYRSFLLKNYDQTYTQPTLSIPSATTSNWDTAQWDVSLFKDYATDWKYQIYRKTYGLNGVGISVTQAFHGICNTAVLRLVGFEYLYETGNNL